MDATDPMTPSVGSTISLHEVSLAIHHDLVTGEHRTATGAGLRIVEIGDELPDLTAGLGPEDPDPVPSAFPGYAPGHPDGFGDRGFGPKA